MYCFIIHLKKPQSFRELQILYESPLILKLMYSVQNKEGDNTGVLCAGQTITRVLKFNSEHCILGKTLIF